MDENRIQEAMERARKNYDLEQEQLTPSEMTEPIQEVTLAEPEKTAPVLAAQPSAYPSELRTYEQQAENALRMVDDIVLKNYLTKLGDMALVVSSEEINLKNEDFMLFKINKMVYEKDEYATDKFISVVNAMTYANCSIYLIVDGQGNHTDFYLGIKGMDDNRGSSSIAKTFENALKGQFPGVLSVDLSRKEGDVTFSMQEQLMAKINDASAMSSYAGIPAIRNSKGEYTNANFIQGIEKFATAMQGHRYTAIILATNTSAQEIVSIRQGYENIYTELSAMATQQLAYSTNESLANAISRTKGSSDSFGSTLTKGTSDSHSENESDTEGTNWSKGESHENKWAKVSKVLASVGTALGVAATATGVGAPVGLALLGVSGAAFATGLKAGTENSSEGGNKSKTRGTTDTHTTTSNLNASK